MRASADVDRRLVARLAAGVALLFIFVAGFSTLNRFYSRKFLGTNTRNAQWIWASHRMSSRVPVAFFATRDFQLPPGRRFTKVKLYGDPQYTLYFNGREVASRRVGTTDRMDQYDVSAWARDGHNRLVIAMRSTLGIGGLIVGVDIDPENENHVVSDGNWRIFRVWRSELLLRDPPGQASEAPTILGEPPFGRWNYLGVTERAVDEPPTRVLSARAVTPVRATVPTVREVSGVYVAGTESRRAEGFDFGATQGRVRLTLDRDTSVPRLIHFRFANLPEELTFSAPYSRAIVFAPGERSVIDPTPERFRYVLVFANRVKADVVQ